MIFLLYSVPNTKATMLGMQPNSMSVKLTSEYGD